MLIDLLVGRIDLKQARAKGLRYQGDPEALGRLQPKAVQPASSRAADPQVTLPPWHMEGL